MGSDPPVTYLGAVPTWEVDRNEHWSMRFYIRAFQAASEVFSLLQSGRNPGAGTTAARHIRFHHELRVGEDMQIRTGRVTEGRFAGSIVHLMESDGRLAAAALDRPGYDLREGPVWEETEVAPAIPRGLAVEADALSGAPPGGALEAIIGVIRPDEVDHTGDFMMHGLFVHSSSNSQHLLAKIGYTPAYLKENRRNRMAVEGRITRHGPCRAGDALRVRSWISGVASKSFTVRHVLSDAVTDAAVASTELCLLHVNLDTRRAEELPDFVREAFEGQQATKI